MALLLTAAAGIAQQPRQPPCKAPEASQFDFWLGDWELERWVRTGPGVDDWRHSKAKNLIIKDYGGCVVREVFTADVFAKGESFSVWDPRAKKWRQLWVDNSGSYLDFEGEWQEDGRKMILSLERETPRGAAIFRMVWENITEDSLDWRYENSRDGGETWFPTLKSKYRRRPSSSGE